MDLWVEDQHRVEQQEVQTALHQTTIPLLEGHLPQEGQAMMKILPVPNAEVLEQLSRQNN